MIAFQFTDLHPTVQIVETRDLASFGWALVVAFAVAAALVVATLIFSA